MSTQTIHTQSPDRHVLARDGAARRFRVRSHSAAALAPGQDHRAAPSAASPDHPDARRQAGGAGGAQVLRRWSVTDLIARAGGAPRAFA